MPPLRRRPIVFGGLLISISQRRHRSARQTTKPGRTRVGGRGAAWPPRLFLSLSVARYVGGEDASWPHRARSLASRLCRRPARGRGKRSAMPASSAKGEKARAFLRTRLGTCPDVAAAFCAILFFFGWGCAGRPRTTQSRGARHPSPAPEQGCPRSCLCANTVQVRRAVRDEACASRGQSATAAA